MQKTNAILNLILSIISIILLGILLYKSPQTSTNILTNKYSKERDSLNIIDTTLQHNLTITKYRYETIRTNIIGQSVDSDCVYFSKYLSKNNKRFINSDDTNSVKAN